MANKHTRPARQQRELDAKMVERRPSGAPPTGVLIKGDANMTEMGQTGLSRWGGTISEEFLTELRGAKGRKVYTEMAENDPVIAAMLRAIDWICRGANWTADGENEEQVEFLQSCMDDMSFSWQDTISEVLTMLVYGWSYFEVVYKTRKGPDTEPISKYDDGRIGWRKWAIRGQNTLYEWDLDDTGGIRGMVQDVSGGQPVNIPIAKSLLFRTQTTLNNPEGKSLLRPAYRPWFFMKNMQEIEGIGIERDLAGLPVVYLGEGCSTSGTNSDYALAKQLVRDVRRDEQEGVVIPKPKLTADGRGMLFELLSTGGDRSFDIGAVIARYEKRIAMVVLAQWLMLGMDQVGSYALSQDQSDFFRQALESILKNICSTINRFAVPRLFNLNPTLRAKSEELPEVTYSFTFKPDLAVYAQAVNAMLQGQVLDPFDEGLQTKMREVLDLPRLTEEQKQELEDKKAQREEQREKMAELAAQGAQAAQEQKPGEEKKPPFGKQPEEDVEKAVMPDPTVNEDTIAKLFTEWDVDPAKFLRGIAKPRPTAER